MTKYNLNVLHICVCVHYSSQRMGMFAVIKHYPIAAMCCLFTVDHGPVVQSCVDKGERRKPVKEGALHHGL